MADVLAELSKYSMSTIIPDSETAGIVVDCYFRENTTIDEILETFEKTYFLKRTNFGKNIILRSKKKDAENILIGKTYDIFSKKELQDVKIVLKRTEEYEYFSGMNGEYIVDYIDTGVYFITAFLEGYEYVGDFIEIEKGVNEKNIYLSRKDKVKYVKLEKEFKQKNEKDDIIEHVVLENISYTEVEKIIKETFTEDIKVSVSPASNGIILAGKGEKVYKILELIEKLDKKHHQIRVTAEVIDVKENKFEDVGFRYGLNNQKQSAKLDSGFSFGLLSNIYTDGLGSVIGSSFNFISKFNNGAEVLNINLSLLETMQELKVNALPSIILLNGEPGEFKMVEEVIVGENKEENEENDKVNYEPIFKEAGIILQVTPNIKENKDIYLDINLEVSDFKLKRTFSDEEQKENDGTFNAEGGSKISRSIKTKVRLKDNEVILIGGLKRKVSQNLNSKVPILGDIPVIGYAFQNKSQKEEYTDLYIKLKAEIIEEY